MVVLDDASMPDEFRRIYQAIMGERADPHATAADTRGAQHGAVDGRLLDELGLALNREARGMFPQGINLSFARTIPGEDVVEYRCFERGIYRETLACGTAAVAVASILRDLGRTGSRRLTFWPKRSRGNAFYSNACIQVSEDDSGEYWLRGQAKRVYDATLRTSEYPSVGGTGRRPT